MGMRKSTLYALLGAEIGAGIVGMLVGGGCISGVILFILRRIFLSKSGMGGRAREGYGIFLSDCKFDIDRHICDRSDDHPGFLPV